MKKTVLVHICLTLMRSLPEELSMLDNDPDEFVSLALDTCDKQQSQVIKTQAAKLLESISDHIDGAVSYTCIFCCNAVSFALKHQKENIANFVTLTEFQDSLFLQLPPELIAETSLIALTTISYIVPKRPDLVLLFE